MPRAASIQDDFSEDDDETLDESILPAAAALNPQLVPFVDAFLKIGDVTKAYLATHKRCNSASMAKRSGRELLKRPDVQAYIAARRAQLLDSTGGTDTAKLSWQAEVRSLAFSRVSLKKVPIKEKNAALRTYGEAMGWLKQPNAGAAGVRATFTFVVPGLAEARAAREAQRGRTIEGMPVTEIAAPVPDPGREDGDSVMIEISNSPDSGRTLFDSSNS